MKGKETAKLGRTRAARHGSWERIWGGNGKDTMENERKGDVTPVCTGQTGRAKFFSRNTKEETEKKGRALHQGSDTDKV